MFQENICRAQLPSGDLLGSGYTEDVWESIVEMDTGVCVHVVYSMWGRGGSQAMWLCVMVEPNGVSKSLKLSRVRKGLSLHLVTG